MPGPWDKYAATPESGPWQKYAAPPPTVPASFSQQHDLGPIAAPVADALEGVGSGVWSTLQGAYNLIRMVPGVGDKLPPPNEFIHHLTEAPDTIAGHAGKLAEQGAEFIIPVSKIAKATEGARLIMRAAAQGAGAGAVRAVQTGGDIPASADAAVIGAAGPMAGAAYQAVAPKVAGAASALAGKIALKVAGKITGLPLSSLNSIWQAGRGLSPEVAAAVEKDPELLDAIAKQVHGFKDFAGAPEELKQIIRNQAAAAVPKAASQSATVAPEAAVQPGAAAPPTTTPVRPPIRPAPPDIAAMPQGAQPAGPVRPPLSVREMMARKIVNGKPEAAAAKSPAELLRDEMLANGSITEANLSVPETPEPVSPAGKKALAGAMRDLPPGTPKAVADASYAGNQEPAVAAATYEAAGRAAKSQNLSQMLHDEGLSSVKVAKWTPEEWLKAADERGMPHSFSKTSQGEVIRMLRKLEKTVPKK